MLLRAATLACVVLLLVACSDAATQQVRRTTPALVNAGSAPAVYEKQLVTKPYHIDKKYMSMKGPDSVEKLLLLEAPAPELLWIVGYEAVVVDADTKDEISQEFMCHANLDFNPQRYFRDFGSNASMSGRLFTLSQGQQKIELPQGFGIPIMSNVPLSLFTQVLNLNLPEPDLNLRHRVVIRFVRDSELNEPITPVFQAAVQGFKSLENQPAHYGESTAGDQEHGPGCAVGIPAVVGDMNKDQFGQAFTGHWVVKPGREENRTLVTNFLQLQFDTTAHYIAVHLHPFAESLELIDRTTGKSLFKSIVDGYDDKVGIERISYFTSQEGIALFTDHEYELVSIYNNTSGEDQDSMAVMYMYVVDRHFRPPSGSRSEQLMRSRSSRTAALPPR